VSSKSRQSHDDSLKVEVSASSFALEAKGDAASRATHALLDLVSPFTNAMGWVGEQLSYARKLAAIRAASQAAKKLREEGISEAKIPPKVFLPWLEGASLETDEVENLSEAWAGLFVRAAKSSDAVTLSYIETLKKLGKPEAELLQFFATDTSPFYSEGFYGEKLIHIFSESNPLRHNLIGRLEKVLRKKPTVGSMKDLMEHFGLQGMCQVIFFSAGDARMVATKFFEENEHVIANLQHLGLISVNSAQFSTEFGVVEVIYFEITKYAFDLVWACQGILTGRKAHIARESASKKESPKDTTNASA
jgi:hypothetical protein